ncbi:MAG: ABC transporter permease [Rhodospirillum sp.]|nr:ABC transporter permease [Rhodospirillum sp.]MCF8488667.1 ABC transporter permease [Rhodospirillum sp.]
MTPVIQRIERIGQATTSGVQELGHAAMLFLESLFWVAFGRLHRQPVRLSAIIRQAMEIGITALPIILVMNGTIGMMLAIQGIYTLRTFGAEQQVVFGVAFSVVREFAPLITGILVAGRSGSSLAARLGTMKINQEIDALTVMGIDPTRFLVAPALIASLVMVPLMTFMAMGIAMLGAGFYVQIDLGMSLPAFFDESFRILRVNDLAHGLGKSGLFALEIVLVGVVNGASVTGGAEGVGRLTTRSVVQAISAIIVTDMIFAFILTR